MKSKYKAAASTATAVFGLVSLGAAVAMPVAATYNLEGITYTTDWQYQPCGASTYIGPYFYQGCTEGYYFTAAFPATWKNPAYSGSAEWTDVRDSFNGHQPFFWAADCQNASVSASCEVDLNAADLGPRHPDGTVTLGQAQLFTYPGTNNIEWGEVTITTNSAVSWYLGTGTEGSTQYDLQATVAHEMGHQLGMAHSVHGPGDATTMECVTYSGITKHSLATDDQRGLLYMYSGHASDFGSPGPAAGC